MSIEEVKKIEDLFIPYDGLGKMKTFHNRETGQVVIIIYDPNIIGITKLKDILTLNADALANLNLYFKTRDQKELEDIFKMFRKYKKINPSLIEVITPLVEQVNKLQYENAVLIEKSNSI